MTKSESLTSTVWFFTLSLKLEPEDDSPGKQTAWQHGESAQAEGLSVTVFKGVAIIKVQFTFSGALQKTNTKQNKKKKKNNKIYSQEFTNNYTKRT